jgi:glycosyltransferase involved in cell wall biosynthesis
MIKRRDILYCEGPGDIVAAHAAWAARGNFIGETSVTFSEQLFECCRLERLTFHAVSHCGRAESVETPMGTVANVPRWNFRIPKIGYELTVFVYALRLLLLAMRVRPRLIFISAGVMDWAYLPLLRLSGANLAPILHNTLWPEGFRPPVGLRQRIYGFVWRRCVWLTLAVSPACARQVQSVAGDVSVSVFRPNFPASSFAEPPAAKDFASPPLRVIFAGRIEQNKGVFDILDMAEALPAVEFSLCGDGQALPDIRRQIDARALSNVKTFGKLNRPQLLERYLDSHLVIVPTRSNFTEGFAMVVAEAILLLRPVITSPVVPAAEVLPGAVICVETDRVQGYIDAIRSLNAETYSRLVDNARALRPFILDDSTSFLAALRSAIGRAGMTMA